MKAGLFLIAATLALAACADYGYVYHYDPYLGPRGHYAGPFEHPPHRSGPDCARYVFSGPFDAGYRGTYLAGPYCDAGAGPEQPPAGR